MKIKIFNGYQMSNSYVMSFQEVQDKINEFIKDKVNVNIMVAGSRCDYNHPMFQYVVMYEEEKWMKLDKFIEKYGNVAVNEEELKDLLGIKDEKYFIPEEDGRYFAVNMAGRVYQSSKNSSLDQERINNSEVFRTVEEAEEHAKKQRFLLKMKRDFLDNSDEIDWKDSSQKKHFINYNNKVHKIAVKYNTYFQSKYLYTTNEEWLEEYIEKYEDEIKKYYFEIKEEKSLPNTTVIRSSLSSYIQLLEKIFKEPKIKITKDLLYVLDGNDAGYVHGNHIIMGYFETKDVEILYYDGQDYVPVLENDTYKEIFKKTKELIGGIKY